MSTSTDPHEPGETGTDTRDFAETVSDYAELSDNPQDVTNRQDDDDVTDRAVFIGRDGRWAAGWALRFIIFVAATYILGRILGFIWAGILPIVLALLVATVLWPPTKLLRDKLKFAPALATVVVLVGFFAVIGGIFAAMAPIVRNQGADLVEQAAAGIRQLSERIQGPPFNVNLGEFDGVLNDLTGYLQDQSSQIASGVFTGLSAATSVVVTIVVMLVLTFFFLKDGPKLWNFTLRWFRGETRARLAESGDRTIQILGGYVRGTVIIATVDAVVIGLALFLLGVPLALPLAVIVFVGAFLPIIGATVAGILATLVALVTNGLVVALIVVAVVVVVTQLEGDLLQPVVMGRTLSLHAIVVLLALSVGTIVGGIFGAILSVPLAAVGWSVVQVWTDTYQIGDDPVLGEDPVHPKDRVESKSTMAERWKYQQMRYQERFNRTLYMAKGATLSRGDGAEKKNGRRRRK